MTPDVSFNKEIHPHHTLPIWMESLIGVDWALLHLSPLYYGFGVPKGDKSPVILVPGFLTTDIYLYELYFWLARIGYQPYLSNIGWNADCLNTLANKLSETIFKASEETGKKVHLIGHSLGGILSRSAAAQNKEKVASIITLASPFRGVRSHPCVLDLAERIRKRIFLNRSEDQHQECYTGFCECAAVSALQKGKFSNIKQTAIYSKTDGIVDWESCIHNDSEKDFEVTGTHCGMAFNYQVYKLIAERLK